MPDIQRFTIQGRLIGLNEYTKQNRTNRFAGNKAKQQDQGPIVAAIYQAHLKPVRNPVYIRYLWVEPNMRRDKDNIAFAQKFIQDALVARRILPDDGWEWVTGFEHDFAVDKRNPRIEVEIREVVARG